MRRKQMPLPRTETSEKGNKGVHLFRNERVHYTG